ncbi:MAG TPA: hypothetical protein VMX74_05280 [Pirellulales bacterium]|nr:hypothetical protein [Pirellulales bacterium]
MSISRPKLVRATIALACPLWLVVCGGCVLVKDKGEQAARPLAMPLPAEEQIEIDVVFVRIPDSGDFTIDELWSEVDEQSVSASQRRRLWKNGFRAGVLADRMPIRLEQILNTASSINGDGTTQIDDIDLSDAGAAGRRMLLQPGKHGEVVAAPVQPELKILHVDEHELTGDTFQDAQPQFSITAELTDDGQVGLSLIPEVHHGEFRQHFVPGEGMFRLDNRRDKKVFPQLRIPVRIAPGQVVMLGAGSGRTGSLGHQFFTDDSTSPLTHKLLLIRVATNSFGSIFDQPSSPDHLAAQP